MGTATAACMLDGRRLRFQHAQLLMYLSNGQLPFGDDAF